MNVAQTSKMRSPTLDAPKVLIADDDEATRILLRMALTQWGYQVVEARDGEEAWKILLQPDPPQILTLDWLMPKLDGVSLCKRIEKELNFHPYIIFLTRMAGTENVIQGLEAGADEFIFKPFDLPELRIRVFAGERIIKYRNQLTEKNQQLQEYVAKIKEITESHKTPLVPASDLLVLLNEISNNLCDVNDNLTTDKEKNELPIKKIQAAQSKVHNIIEVLKALLSKPAIEKTTNIEKPHTPTDVSTPTVTAAPIASETPTIPAPKAITAPSIATAPPAEPKPSTPIISHTPGPAVVHATPQSENMINMPRMQAFFGHDMPAIQEFIKTFISLSSDQVNQIETAIKNKDSKSAKYLFHLLGSASGNSGMTKIYDVCGIGEDKATKLEWDAAADCHRTLKHMLDQLRLELASNFKR